ncbi:male sterile (3) 76Cc [Musca autumnalis]|uniref:male sterile (3) 76Cc n=1 Tax=Musca autumnalis TaxID=221902 RepID=UPI003CE8B61C
MDPECGFEGDANVSPCHDAPRTEMCGKQKFEPQNADLLICNTKNCQIYGGHDTNPFPNYPCPARVIKAKDPNKNSLGSPVGMIASSINFKSESKPSDISQARYATYLKAFARLYLNPEYMWTTELLDDIMREGLALYALSEKEENQLESPAHIYSESERRIQREFQMAGCTFHVELMKKYKLDEGDRGDGKDVGDGGEEVPLRHLKKSLKNFLREHKHCLLTFGNAIYVLLWRSQGAYMILDVCGRRSDFRSDREKGMAMLVCLKTLENVRHLLVGLTTLAKIDSFNLREMKMVKVLLPSGEVLQRDYGLRVQQWEIVNDDYGYLKASLHLTLNPKDLLRNRSALPVGIMAIVISKIDHPATWNMKILDKIMCFGVRFCQACWASCPQQQEEGINATQFPSIFDMAQYRIRIELKPQKYEGLWRCTPGFRHSEMADLLQKAFNGSDHRLLLQINFQLYAIWKKQDFIYLFDPYRHRILGQAGGGNAETYEEMEKSASLRMFGDFEVFMNTLNHILLDSNRNSRFYIHTLRVLSILKRDQRKEKGLDEDSLKFNAEVSSLNEHVCFEESDDFCQKLLADISDYEDEDLLSDVDELELRTSSSEGEEGLEEEEAGNAGEEEEMEGLESSSSGEEELIKNKANAGAKGGKSKTKKGKKGNKSSGKGGKKAGGGENDKERKKAGESAGDEEPNKAGNDKEEKKETVEKEKKQKAKEDEGKKNVKPKEPVKELEKITKEKPVEDNQNKQKSDLNKQQKSPQHSDKESNKDKDKTPSPPSKPAEPPVKPKQDKQVEANILPKDKEPAPDDVPKKSTTKPKCPKTPTCGHEADDEHEEPYFDFKHLCTTNIPNPNRCPGYYKSPLDMAVVGSQNGSYESLSKLLLAGFSRADRLLAMTPWGNFVVFRCVSYQQQQQGVNALPHHLYYLFDGCTCNVNRFRHLDLSLGTAGLLCFKQLHDVIEYMRQIRKQRSKEIRCKRLPPTAEEICQEYCN